jgi:hypothetical protein
LWELDVPECLPSGRAAAACRLGLLLAVTRHCDQNDDEGVRHGVEHLADERRGEAELEQPTQPTDPADSAQPLTEAAELPEVDQQARGHDVSGNE